MKIFQVIYEQDGATEKTPGKITTTIEQYKLFYAAEHMEEVLDAILWIRDDLELNLIDIQEIIPQCTVITGKEK